MDKAGCNINLSKQLKLLLVGRDGNGKTSTVKTIENTCGTKLKIKAEQCSGIGDTGEDLTKNINTVINNVFAKLKASRNNDEIVYIVFVLRYGARFTKQEQDAVDAVKLMFGDDVLRHYGLVLMTHGDSFSRDNEENGITLKDWCRQQTGGIEELFKEVNYRTVLFDNKTKDETKKKEQLNVLCDVVSGMKGGYGIERFEEAKSGRKQLIQNENELKRIASVVIRNLVHFKEELFVLFSWLIFLTIVVIFILFFTRELLFTEEILIFVLLGALWVAVKVTLRPRGIAGLRYVKRESRNLTRPSYNILYV